MAAILNFHLNQTLVEWSLDGPLPKLCPVIPTSNQDGPQAKNSKKGDDILNWLSSFRGEDFFFNFIPPFSNLHNRSKSAKVHNS
jgi:hypothetical protein